jgi:prepilin-type N-terminal cleavage/methylation domain-containing protein
MKMLREKRNSIKYKTKHKRGFSLIELVVVIAIMAILLMIFIVFKL